MLFLKAQSQMDSSKNQNVKQRLNSSKHSNAEPLSITKKEYEQLKEANMELDRPIIVRQDTIYQRCKGNSTLKGLILAFVLALALIVSYAIFEGCQVYISLHFGL